MTRSAVHSERPNIAMLSSPTESKDDSTLDNDVFDGIDDIYADLEANPPPAPPSSKDDILEAQRINISSSSSIGINQNDPKQESVEYGEEFPYICGIQSPKKNVWNIFKVQSYFEMEDVKETKTQN